MKLIKDICGTEVVVFEETMTCQCEFDLDGWDNKKKAYYDIDLFAEGANDMIGEDIEIELEKLGYELIYPGTVDEQGTTVEFKLGYA